MDTSSSKKIFNWTGIAVFLITATVFFFSVERTGSLWDCGEFIAGAAKLEVVHPPGAPLFLLIGRMFTVVAELFSDDPTSIAFSVNMLSGLATALAAMLICWVTIMLGKLALKGREEDPDQWDTVALAGAGLVAGLTTAFASSIWFSAVEGEVYALSTFFTCLTLWAMVKWYYLPDEPDTDRWAVFALYSAGLSIGVHLLSILTFPALALLYYFKKYRNHNLVGMAAAVGMGLVFMVFIQKIVLVGIPTIWSKLDIIMVNSFGMPVNSGVIPLIILLVGGFWAAFRWVEGKGSSLGQKLIFSAALVVIGFSTLGMVVIRANANTPINMNNPDNPFQLITYLNREQYGERPLIYGPSFATSHNDTEVTDRYKRVGDKYEMLDKKVTPLYPDNKKMLFPRMGHQDNTRQQLYRAWMGLSTDLNTNLPPGRPSFSDNIGFFFDYQLRWMYWRYFMWNFSGRQNGEQGTFPWGADSGNWISGIPLIDNWHIGNQAEITTTMRENEGRNKYYMLPFLFGLLGLLFHALKRKEEFVPLLGLFIITGVGLIIYANSPPNEPRERDYVFAGSFFTYAIWIGMGVLAMYRLMIGRMNLGKNMAAIASTAIILVAPLLMGFQNFDDHSRSHHTASRDYAANFLNSVDENAIIFTYGDNDTYPLWYAQEVENIRTDVRVVNLSLIAVDWYIEQLRRKVNDSPAIKMSMPQDKIRGFKRNQLPIDPNGQYRNQAMSLTQALKIAATDNKIPLRNGGSLEGYWPTKKLFIPVNRQKAISMGMISPNDTTVTNKMEWNLSGSGWLYKGDVAVLDIINSNIWERPVYFAVTCQQSSMMGIQNYTQLEGLALRVIPKKSAGQRSTYSMLGNGRVATEKIYENVTQKFAWGNFDKEKLFVDRSYGPSIQTTRVMILRATSALIAEGKNDKAKEMLDTYFNAYPHMNFPFDGTTLGFFSLYGQCGNYEAAKPHIETLGQALMEELKFYASLDQDDLGDFGRAPNGAKQTAAQLIGFVGQNGDTVLKESLETKLKPYL